MSPLHRLCHAALLSLALLFAQHGAVRHALTHGDPGASQRGDKRGDKYGDKYGDKHAATADRCDQCAAFAQVSSGLAMDVAARALLNGIAFALRAPPAAPSRSASRPAPRSRDPPARA